MERRTHNRSPVRLDAVVYDLASQAWDFVIEDFGCDGLRLSWKNKSTMPQSIGVNDVLTVKFTLPHSLEQSAQTTNQDFHLDIKVTRILDNTLAVVLFNPALEAMSDLSKKQQQQGMHQNSQDLHNGLDDLSHKILLAVKACFMNNLAHMTEIFLPIARDALFLQTEQSSSNTQQMLFFDAINTLDKVKVSLKDEFLKLMAKHLSSCGNKPQLKQSNGSEQEELEELELLDQNDFEIWLAVNQLIVNVSPHYEQELKEIELRLEEILGSDVKESKDNPFSPGIIFNSFSETIHNHFVNNDILLILYKQFEKVVNNHLFKTYQEINQLFIENNILPLLEKKKPELIREVSNNTGNSTGENNNPLPKSAVELPVNLPVHPVHTSQPPYLSEVNPLQSSINLVPTYQTLKELLSFQSGHNFVNLSDDFFASQEYRKQLSLLINDLSEIQFIQAKDIIERGIMPFELDVLLSSCIDEQLYSVELINEFNYTLDIIKRLFQSIQDDEWLSEPVKKLLSILQIPLLKVSLLHKDVFESGSNPARLLINKLAKLSFDDENNSFYLKAHSFILFILKNYKKDLIVFSKVQKMLTELQEIQLNKYTRNVEQLNKRWNAQQIVTDIFAKTIKGLSIPLSIADFISYQWLPVMVATYLKHGKQCSQWSQYLQTLDMIKLSIKGDINDDLIDKDVILFIIKQGLEENEQYDEKIISQINTFLTHAETEQTVQLDQESIIKLLINGYSLSDESALSRLNRGVTDAIAFANQAIAKRIKINDYFICNQNQKTTRLQYVWSDREQNIFVFSDSSGNQQAVFNLNDVASMLDKGILTQNRDNDLPILERNLFSILGNVQDTRVKEKARDSITGLMNQKEFAHCVKQRLLDSENTSTTCALCLIDIDQFSLINDTCGYEAGDQYIAEISQIIKNNLSEGVVIARYGIDEFILMLPDISESAALDVSESYRKAISQYHFKWEEKEFSMSASIGLVSISENNDLGVYLKAVVTAATIAKETGRNRVHLIEYDAVELNYRQELQIWATRIDQMVKDNQLDIRCQRLHPLLDEATVEHYEMLLLVKDGKGAFMPPAEFIEAAELYNKMIEVDRWVIRTVFDWFSKHPEQLEIMGGIAINLSGQSLNDMDFLSFIEGIFAQYPDIPHQKICFEITETMAITNMNHTNNIIHQIKDMGCEFSLDDFGTGLSSYAYLKNLPVDYLKIDGVFIKDIAKNPEDRAMVKSINEIGHFLGMKTVAEYVENDEIVEILKEIGVDYAQGFGVEKPIMMTEYMQVIEARETHEKLKQACNELSHTED